MRQIYKVTFPNWGRKKLHVHLNKPQLCVLNIPYLLFMIFFHGRGALQLVKFTAKITKLELRLNFLELLQLSSINLWSEKVWKQVIYLMNFTFDFNSLI